MYAWIWRRIPGPPVVRTLVMVAVGLGILAGLWFWAFPPLYEWLDVDQATIEQSTANEPGPSASPGGAG